MKIWFNNLSNNSKGIILAIIGFSCYACADANAKHLTLAYSPEQIAGTVAMFSTLLCFSFAPFLGGLKKTFKTKKRKIHLARGLLNPIISLLVLYSFAKFSMSATYSIIFMAPFITTMLAIPLFKEKVSMHGWIAIIGGFIGVLIVVQPGSEALDIALLLPLLGAFFIALLFLSAKPLGNNETLVSLALYPMMTNLLVITPFVVYHFGIPAQDDLYLFLIQAMLVVTGLICTTFAFRIAKASLISPFLYGEILWGIGFDTFLFKDPPGIWTLIGGGVVVASGIYLIETERRSMKLEHERV